MGRPRGSGRRDERSSDSPPETERLPTPRRVGFVSVWFERGQAYVTRAIRDAVARRAETFVFARTGAVFGQAHLETSGYWSIPHLTVHPQYEIPPDSLAQWINENRLDAVIFNEEYDWALVRAAKATGVKILTYLDFFAESWRAPLRLYDAVLCSTRRTHDLVSDHPNARYVGWGVDLELFRPRTSDPAPFTFFHNAGWLGNQYRKMTPATLLAFHAISKFAPWTTLLVHMQTPVELLPTEALRIARENPKIKLVARTMPAPGLYTEGQVHVFPSKLEGLGLPLLEGLACGLATITTDAAPMNEFVIPKETGLLAKVARRVQRADGVAFPETLVDVLDLAMKMAGLAFDPDTTSEMGRRARRWAEANLDPIAFAARVNAALNETLDVGGGS